MEGGGVISYQEREKVAFGIDNLGKILEMVRDI